MLRKLLFKCPSLLKCSGLQNVASLNKGSFRLDLQSVAKMQWACEKLETFSNFCNATHQSHTAAE